MIINHQKFDFKEKSLIEKVTVKAPFRFSVNFPNEACFIYFEEGTTIMNSPHEQVGIKTDDSVLLKCGTYFSNLLIHPESDLYKIIVVHLPKNILKEIYKNEMPSFFNTKKAGNYIQRIEGKELVSEFIKGLHFYFNNPSVVSDELLALKIKELILLLMQTKNAVSLSALFSQLFTTHQVSIREVINNHIFSNLSIDDLAELCNLSTSTFKRQFKSLYNDTPANYIKLRRLERAKELLTLKPSSISQVAYDTGFNDIAHFSKSFKYAYKCSPSEYKLKAT